MLSLDEMVANGRIADFTGAPFEPWEKTTRTLVRIAETSPGKGISVPIAKLNQPRHVYEVITADDCKKAQADSFLNGPDTADCRPGTNIDLFPATTVYFTANTVEP
ncbi:hypothetical protein AB4084_33885, partial [Lysobacter sp. 2RAB21]